MEQIKTATWEANREALLKTFERLVKPGSFFEKMPYCIWRELSRSGNPKMTITRCRQTDLEAPYDLLSFIVDGKHTFTPSDNSFGLFLDGYWQHPSLTYTEGKTDMNENTLNGMANANTATNAYATGGYTTAGTIINSHDYVTDHTITTGDPGYWTNTVTIPNYSYVYNGGVSSQDDVKKIINDILNEKEKEKEKEKMDTSKMFKFDFGPVSGSQFRMSPYGLAVRTAANGWVAFNTQTNELVDVEVLNFDVSKMIYKMPVAMGAIAVGDILIHGGKPVFVRSIGDGVVNVIDYSTASVMDILPVKSPFGFNFFTKVMCLVDMSGMSAASPENPFGNMLPYLLLSEGKDFDPLMLMLMGGGTASIGSNPMMMYFLLNDSGDNKSLLPLIMMMNGGGMPSGNAGPATI